MSDLRTAAQQALGFVTSEAWGTTPYMDVRVYEDAARLRDVLQAALAQQAEPVEPVAWNWMLDGLPYGRACYGDPPDADIAERAATAGRSVRLLYTAPPQRKPLTEEEILKAIGWERAEMYMKLATNFPVDEAKQETLKNARAVERAVWEKNHG